MAEKLISIIKDPHLAFHTFKREDGYKVYTLSWCKYKVLSAEEIDVGTRIRIRSAQDDIELTWRAFPMTSCLPLGLFLSTPKSFRLSSRTRCAPTAMIWRRQGMLSLIS